MNFFAELIGTSEAWAMAPEEAEPVEPPDAPAEVDPLLPEEAVLPPLLLLSPPPQAATTEAPAVVTPIAAPSRINFLREIIPSKTSSCVICLSVVAYVFMYASQRVLV